MSISKFLTYLEKKKSFLVFMNSSNNRPIFDIPGILSSPLYVHIIDKEKYAKLLPEDCHDLLNSEESKPIQIWPLNGRKIQSISCLLETEAMKNSEGNIMIRTPCGIQIRSDPITKVVNESDIPYPLKGYTNVYHVPYDWVHYFFIDDAFQSLKTKIEEQVNETHLKAVLVSYSMGGNFVRYFLTHYIKDNNWIKQNIAGAQFGAGGVAGAFLTTTFLSRSYLFNPAWKSDFFKHMPSLIVLFPNFNISKNVIEKVIISENSDGTTSEKKTYLGASDIFNEMKMNGVTDETMELIYQKCKWFLEEDIKDPQIPTNFLYNSGMQVETGVKVTINGSNTQYELIKGPGDGQMPANGIEYVIQHWHDVQFHDFKTTNKKYDHGHMANHKNFQELTRNFIDNLKD